MLRNGFQPKIMDAFGFWRRYGVSWELSTPFLSTLMVFFASLYSPSLSVRVVLQPAATAAASRITNMRL